MVTLDGQVINAGGSYTGGSAKNSSGVLSRSMEIDKMISMADELAKFDAIKAGQLQDYSEWAIGDEWQGKVPEERYDSGGESQRFHLWC